MRLTILAIAAALTCQVVHAQDVIDPVTGGILYPDSGSSDPTPVLNQGVEPLPDSMGASDYLPTDLTAHEPLPVADERADERLYPADVTPPMRGAIMTIMTAYHGPVEVDLRQEQAVLFEDMRPFTYPAIAECEKKYVGIFKRKKECETIMGNAYDGVRVTRQDETCLIEEYAVNGVSERQRETKHDVILMNVNQYAREWRAPCPVHKRPTGLWARLTRSAK